MANSYFQFKQFIVQQDRCAMKVTTDGCLIGAIVAKEIALLNDCKVLDIGAGTGLLSLMIAQENTAVKIDAVEIDEAAATQATENVSSSPWNNSIQVLQTDILDYQPVDLYDVVVSNPPFYEKQLSSPKAGRQLAHHSAGLTLDQLFHQAKKLLKESGEFYVLLPFYRLDEAATTAGKFELYLQKKWLIKQTVKHDFFRIVLCFSLNKNIDQLQIELSIKDEQNQYTEEFIRLLQPFYLNS